MKNKEAKDTKDAKDAKNAKDVKDVKDAKRKLIPPFVMLTAGAVTSILMVVKGCELNEFLGRLLAILIVFYVLGCVLKGMLDRFDRQNMPPEPEEEEDVIEKEAEGGESEGESEESETAEE